MIDCLWLQFNTIYGACSHKHLQYIPWNMHIVLLCFVVVRWEVLLYSCDSLTTVASLAPWQPYGCLHDDVIKWKHFPRYWPFVPGIHRSPVNSLHKGHWCGALMFSFICACINSWVKNHQAGDLICLRAHYDVIVMPVPVKWPWRIWAKSDT